MLETIYATQFARNRHRAAPLLEERERYLQHCAAHGSTHRTQYQRAEELLWLAQRMQPDDRQGVDADRLRQLIEVKPEPSRAHASRAEIHGRNWLKFLGWWRTPPNPVPFEADLKHFVCWISTVHGITACSVGSQLVQGLITSKPRSAKSRPLRVTILKPCCAAVAPKRLSMADNGRPAAATNLPQRCAT